MEFKLSLALGFELVKSKLKLELHTPTTDHRPPTTDH
jgi:hypothetical protein